MNGGRQKPPPGWNPEYGSQQQTGPGMPGPFAPPQPAGPPGGMPRPRIESYYSNCAAVATSPREISVIFGRYLPTGPESSDQGLTPLYEKQILMTVEQAADLVKTLAQAVKEFRARAREQAESK